LAGLAGLAGLACYFGAQTDWALSGIIAKL
jgi:hypothetical protein